MNGEVERGRTIEELYSACLSSNQAERLIAATDLRGRIGDHPEYVGDAYAEILKVPQDQDSALEVARGLGDLVWNDHRASSRALKAIASFPFDAEHRDQAASAREEISTALRTKLDQEDAAPKVWYARLSAEFLGPSEHDISAGAYFISLPSLEEFGLTITADDRIIDGSGEEIGRLN